MSGITYNVNTSGPLLEPLPPPEPPLQAICMSSLVLTFSAVLLLVLSIADAMGRMQCQYRLRHRAVLMLRLQESFVSVRL